jgi:hypothetical protein
MVPAQNLPAGSHLPSLNRLLGKSCSGLATFLWYLFSVDKCYTIFDPAIKSPSELTAMHPTICPTSVPDASACRKIDESSHSIYQPINAFSFSFHTGPSPSRQV